MKHNTIIGMIIQKESFKLFKLSCMYFPLSSLDIPTKRIPITELLESFIG